jgi:hypothetical protein
LIFIFYQYEKIEEEHLSENLFLELKNYSFFFDDTRFDIDIVSNMKEKSPYELYMDKGSVYILVPMPSAPEDMLKVYYPKVNFMKLWTIAQNVPKTEKPLYYSMSSSWKLVRGKNLKLTFD